MESSFVQLDFVVLGTLFCNLALIIGIPVIKDKD